MGSFGEIQKDYKFVLVWCTPVPPTWLCGWFDVRWFAGCCHQWRCCYSCRQWTNCTNDQYLL